METQNNKSIMVDGEEFSPVVGSSAYYVSQSGRVYNSARGRHVTHTVHPIGYHYVRVAMDGAARKNHLVHRLVAKCYIPNPERKPTVNHKDGDKGNNQLSNLEWATMKEQIRHAVDTGLMVANRGAEHHRHGTTATDETRAKQSAAKLGDKHPRFTGYYHTPYGVFGSAREAAKVIETYSHVTIGRKCKEGAEGWAFKAAA